MDSDSPELVLRRQLTAFAQFTTRSLGESDLHSLMTDACLRARAGVAVTHAKLLEYLPSRDRLILRAGVDGRTVTSGNIKSRPISIHLSVMPSLCQSPYR